MKRILILGASGTFGKALVEKLNNDEEFHLTLASRHASACYHESERCHVVDCDAMKADDLPQAMAGCHVVYCAISGDDLPVIAEKNGISHEESRFTPYYFYGSRGESTMRFQRTWTMKTMLETIPTKYPTAKRRILWKTAVWITRYFVRGIYGTGIRMILH